MRAKGEDKEVGHDRRKQTKKIMAFRCFQGVHIYVRVNEMPESFFKVYYRSYSESERMARVSKGSHLHRFASGRRLKTGRKGDNHALV